MLHIKDTRLLFKENFRYLKLDLFITCYYSFFIIFEFKLAKMVQEKEHKIIKI